jgi:predicted nucleic acid-binding protein
LLGVLARKFARDAEELAHLAVFLEDLAEIVEPRRKISMLADEPDKRILECAVAGRAELIVTGDRAMLKLRPSKKSNSFRCERTSSTVNRPRRLSLIASFF